MGHLEQLDVRRPLVPGRLPQRLGEINTPLRWEEWDRSLSAHPDQSFRAYVVSGIRYGFRVGFGGPIPCRKSACNMASARSKPEVIREYLATECSEGRVLGPLDPENFPQIHTSRLGVIPKGQTGKWRLIVDMSSPEGNSINDGIPESLCSLSYVGVKDASLRLQRSGRGSLMAKVDVRSTYRNIPVHPEDRWLLGMMWDGALYVDTALPFGLRSAPKIFTAVADAAQWIIQREGVDFIIHYLDDFLVIGGPESHECAEALSTVLRVFERLGLPVALNKLEGPSTCLTFLGFELDSVAMIIRLPYQKLVELQDLVRTWRGRKACTRSELESLVGKLAHACTVVQPGKTFMRRMFELLGAFRRANHPISLRATFRSDLMWWATFLEPWNGVSMIHPRQSQQGHHIWSDASGNFGCGAVCPSIGRWLQLQWPRPHEAGSLDLEGESITLKELIPIVLACAVWGTDLQNGTVTVHCDNMGTVAIVNSGYSRVPAIMHVLRCLFFIRARFHLTVWAVHIPGVQNTWADDISRDKVHSFLSQVPPESYARSAVPGQLVRLLVDQLPDWTSLAWTQQFGACFPPV